MLSVPRSALFATALLALAVAGAGCGGGDGGDGEDATTAGEAEVTTVEEQVEPNAALLAKARKLIAIARESQMGKTPEESIRIADAQAELLTIAETEPAAIAPLVAALKKPDYDLIADLYNFYIQLGRKGSETVLLDALDAQGFGQEGSVMALAFLESGNPKLVRGTREWARENGLTISGQPSGVGPKWGSMGLAVPQIPVVPPPSP